MISESYTYELNLLDDEQLWNKLKAGNISAFEFIYQSYVQSLYDYGMHIHADSDLVKDAIQELFIHIWQRKENLGLVKNIQNYLLVSLRRNVIQHLEADKKWNIPKLEFMYSSQEAELSHENQLIAQELFLKQEKDLKNAIEQLPARQREVIYLLFYKKMAQKEVSQLMNINLASVYTLTSKAIKNLKRQLQ